jgi:hypothetical protein
MTTHATDIDVGTLCEGLAQLALALDEARRTLKAAPGPLSANLTDAEIDDICAGFVQPLAKVRHLTNLGLRVARKPNGAPLVNRAHYDQVMGTEKTVSRAAGPKWSVR